MNPWIRRFALVAFPAGFAAVAPFLAEFVAQIPLMAAGPAAYDTHTHLFDSANAGEAGKAFGPLWLLYEAALFVLSGRAAWSRWLAAAAFVAAGIPALMLAAGYPLGFRWMAWAMGLGAGLVLARSIDAPSLLWWAVCPALTTFAAFHGWRAWTLPPGSLLWGVIALKPAVAGLVGGLVVRVGLGQGRRWGPTTPTTSTGVATHSP